MSKTTAYLRVSTNHQDLDKNEHEILAFANEKNLGKVKLVKETVSGKVSFKDRDLGKAIEELDKGDNLIVSELSRLGRSMLEILEILSIATRKEITIYALKGNWKLGNDIQSKILAMVFAMASEIERDLISARITEALAAKKRAGIQLGRPKGRGKSRLDPYKEEIIAFLKTGSTKKYISKKYGITGPTLHNWLVKNELSHIKPDI